MLCHIKFLSEEEKHSYKSVSDPNQHGNQSMGTYSFSLGSKVVGPEK